MADDDACIILKKATFYKDRIVIHKRKKDITIPLKEIAKICYAEPTLSNYLDAWWLGSLFPQRLCIRLRETHHGKKLFYMVKMKYNDYCKLPFEYSMCMRGSSKNIYE